MRLFSPFQIWLSFTAVLTLLLIAGALSIWRLADTENQRLTDLEAELLVRARIKDFEHGNLRAVVEGLGPEFNDLYVEATPNAGNFPDTQVFNNDSTKRNSFHVGARTPAEKCSTRLVQTNAPGMRSVRFTLCRPYRAPTLPILAVTAVFLVAATIALFLVRKLERSTVTTLVGFIQRQGVSVTTTLGLAGIMRQIKGIVTQLDEARERDREADKARLLAEIATSVAHDIKAPLAAFDRLLSGVSAIPDRYRRIATAAMSRIRDIAEDLTAHAAAPELYKVSGTIQRVAINRLVEDVVSEARLSHSERRGLVICFAPLPAIAQLRVPIDPQILRRILSNLLNNAVQASTGRGTVTVEVTVDEGWVRLSVTDRGEGISADILPKLGKRGFTFGKPGGQGLGLYHARGATEAWGGTLTISSELGKGTTVAVRLPAVKAKEP